MQISPGQTHRPKYPSTKARPAIDLRRATQWPAVSGQQAAYRCKLLARQLLALPLLMPGIRADHIDPPLAPHDFAVLANPFDACSNFHDASPADLAKATQYSDLDRLATRGQVRSPKPAKQRLRAPKSAPS